MALPIRAAAMHFKLACAALNDDVEMACRFMKQIGTNGGSENGFVDRHAYREWPLFRKLRSRAEFHKAFQEVFGESFNVVVSQEATEP